MIYQTVICGLSHIRDSIHPGQMRQDDLHFELFYFPLSLLLNDSLGTKTITAFFVCSKGNGPVKRRNRGDKPKPAEHLAPGQTSDPERQNRQSDGRSLYKDPCLVS